MVHRSQKGLFFSFRPSPNAHYPSPSPLCLICLSSSHSQAFNKELTPLKIPLHDGDSYYMMVPPLPLFLFLISLLLLTIRVNQTMSITTQSFVRIARLILATHLLTDSCRFSCSSSPPFPIILVLSLPFPSSSAD